MLLSYKPKKGGTIFDFVLNTYCTMNLITKFAIDNNITNFNYTAKGDELYYYDSDLIAKEHISNEIFVNDYKFTTGSLNVPNASFNENYLLTESGEIIATEGGDLITI